MGTIGMNYEVIEGKEGAFEKKFALVTDALRALPGHLRTDLYQRVADRRMYLVVSEWETRVAFEAFIGSSEFQKTTAWGMSGFFAGRPHHRVYETSEMMSGITALTGYACHECRPHLSSSRASS